MSDSVLVETSGGTQRIRLELAAAARRRRYLEITKISSNVVERAAGFP